METLKSQLKRTPVVYITRDIERALGLPLDTVGYYIITNATAFAMAAANGHDNVLLISDKTLLDTRELLTHPHTKSFIQKLKKPRILVFKNTPQIEKIAQGNKWKILNPPAAFANHVEEKLTQLTWLGSLQKYLPPHRVVTCSDLAWHGKKYIVQFNRAHTGLGTVLISSPKQIIELKKKFPNREVRATDFIAGAAFTSNNVVWGKKVLCGNVSYQITGLKPFTTSPFTTVGNDWEFAHKTLNSAQQKQIRKIATDIGKRLAKNGWSGLFGIDVLVEQKTGKVYLIEINARQPASTTYESQLQQKNTIFTAHLAALLGLPTTNYRLQAITTGAQIIERVGAKKINKAIQMKKLAAAGFTTIPYDNTEPGQDLLRIQSSRGIMNTHNKFNALGKKIISLL